MQLNVLADKVRAKMPRALWNPLRKLVNASLTPILFAVQTGHLRSALKSRAVDNAGHPLPWFVYPAIQLLRNKNFSARRVLEWGAGQSTLWWAARSREVVAFEADPAWHAYLCKNHPPNATLHLVQEDLSDLGDRLKNQLFDIIVVDGLDRFRCAELSLTLLAPGGAIIVDNAEGNHGPRPGYGILDLYRESGLARVDFLGFAPGNAIQHCTAIFFRTDCFLFWGEELPVV